MSETTIHVFYKTAEGHEITVAGPSAAAVSEGLADILASSPFGAAEAPAKPARKKRAAKKEETPAEPEAPAAAAKADAGDDWDADEPAQAEQPTLEDVRKVLVPLGRERGVALLKKFKATKLSQVAEDKYAELIEAAKQAEAA